MGNSTAPAGTETHIFGQQHLALKAVKTTGKHFKFLPRHNFWVDGNGGCNFTMVFHGVRFKRPRWRGPKNCGTKPLNTALVRTFYRWELMSGHSWTHSIQKGAPCALPGQQLATNPTCRDACATAHARFVCCCKISFFIHPFVPGTSVTARAALRQPAPHSLAVAVSPMMLVH